MSAEADTISDASYRERSEERRFSAFSWTRSPIALL
jgi:hypothetical protein